MPYKKLIGTILIFLACCSSRSYGENTIGQDLLYPELVNKFYTAIHQRLFWFDTSANKMRELMLQKIDSSAYIGTDRSKYGYNELVEINRTWIKEINDSSNLLRLDMLFTDAAIGYCKDLYQGSGISSGISYDEWSARYMLKDNDYLVGQLAAVKSSNELSRLINSLTPSGTEYIAYNTEFNKQYTDNNFVKAKQVAIAMNFYRWMYHFKFERYIVVNIPSASLKYYENDTVRLFSKMIVGNPSKRSPRFDATCREVILYPYWNVPKDIALKELVPKYKKHPTLVDKENMQILDAKGKIVDPYSINWSLYSAYYFPYRLRQSTGCDNSLGILKFDLTSPFGVYLHDTNEKSLFKSGYRFRSHGCMRVEKAIELGNYLLNNKLDTALLKACIKDENPVTLQLEKPVPVFVVYMTAYENNNTVSYYNDVYRLIINH